MPWSNGYVVGRVRAWCRHCKKWVCCGIPKGGDGSEYVYDRHPREGPRCKGSRQLVEPEDLQE